MSRWPGLEGRRFGHLVVQRRAWWNEAPTDRYGGERCRWWIALCDCGRTRAVNTKRLKEGAVTGCGCFGNKKAPGDAAKWNLYRLTQARARRRGKTFALTFEEFLRLTGAPCAYCGVEWSSDQPSAKRFNGTYRHNGIDRLDSRLGYVADNCTTACATCNRAKAEMSVDEFWSWIGRLAARNQREAPR